MAPRALRKRKEAEKARKRNKADARQPPDTSPTPMASEAGEDNALTSEVSSTLDGRNPKLVTSTHSTRSRVARTQTAQTGSAPEGHSKPVVTVARTSRPGKPTS